MEKVFHSCLQMQSRVVYEIEVIKKKELIEVGLVVQGSCSNPIKLIFSTKVWFKNTFAIMVTVKHQHSSSYDFCRNKDYIKKNKVLLK